MLHEVFSIDDDGSNNSDSQMVPCRMLDNFPIPPANHVQSMTDSAYTCNLSIPDHRPLQKNVIYEKTDKQLPKQECCAKTADIPEVIDKQIAYFPPENGDLFACWYLYRITISNNDDLGFIVPNKLMKLPILNLYDNGEELRVKVVYVGSVDYKECENQLKHFCQYLFEQVFDDMNTGLESHLKFDLEHSTFKLLPCLLKKSGDIGYQRMGTICDRKNKIIRDPSELDDNELYCPSYLSENQLYMNVPTASLPKRVSGPRKCEKLLNSITNYIDYHENEIHDVQIQRDYGVVAMKRIKIQDINYLKDFSLATKKESNTSSMEPHYISVKVLRYAPLNLKDLQLISKLPSILFRIVQLHYIEQLRKLLAENIQSYSLLDVEQMPVVTFNDCLPDIFSLTQSTPLPLFSLNYDLLSENKCELQPSPGLLFQAITRCSAEKNTNMENLETLGDCFLKLTISMSVYHRYPLDDTDKLSIEKDKQVSNANLYRLAMDKDLRNYLNVNKCVFTGEEANWIPPGYMIGDNASERYTKQKAKHKETADMMEALIGAFLISTDHGTTMQLMKWLGLDVFPPDEQNGVMKTPSILRSDTPKDINEINNTIRKFYDEHSFTDIEKTINYEFKDKAYLLAAFTHPTYLKNCLTVNCKRLKFIGNAVLEFLVTRYIFVTKKSITPGYVTHIRKYSLNKSHQADILVTNQLHTKILCSPPKLVDGILSYADKKDFSIDKNNVSQGADKKAPKALTYVFEALVGAIFLDSGYSLETVWDVISPLLQLYIGRSM